MKRITIRIEKNYNYPDFYRQSPGGKGIWNSLEIVKDRLDTDLLIVFNQPVKEIFGTCAKRGKVLIIQEPPYERNNYLVSQFPSYDYIISGFESINESNHQCLPALLPWHVNIDYDTASNLKVTDLVKDKLIVCVTSNSVVNPGHKPRLDFLESLKSDMSFDLFGRGFQPIEDKFNVMSKYKYAICIENFTAKDYWTEKIVDAFLSWNMPIYHGCINMEEYFDPRSYIKIDINNFPKSFAQINEVLRNNLWENSLEFIADSRKRILNEHQFFPFLEKFIDKNKIDFSRRKKFLINNFGYPKSNIFKRLKYGF